MLDTSSIYEQGLQRRTANHTPLSPLTFVKRAASIFPDKIAVVDGRRRFTYLELYRRCLRLASALQARGIGSQDTVAVLAPNSSALIEAHYGIGMAGAVLNTINTRLDADTIRFILTHGEAKAVLVDNELCSVAREAISQLESPPFVFDIVDPDADSGERIGEMDYEALLATGDEHFQWQLPDDEWTALALNYTSGTTGDPKGVVYHHRGAHLNAVGNALGFGLTAETIYLWTLPMFHCNGWSQNWAVTLMGGTHVCLRKVEAAAIYRLIEEYKVTHLSGAPIVLNMLAHASERPQKPYPRVIQIATGGAPPPSSVIERMESLGFKVTHLYGLTESYGPASFCLPQPEWSELDNQARCARMARQGVPMPMLADLMVANPDTLTPVAADGKEIGEILLRGNTLMKGYLKNPTATEKAFKDGWFHTGDLAVVHADGYIEIKDRAKDLIISGGENISTVEIEEVLYRHPSVMEAAVVAKPDNKWGETPCAFVTLNPGATPVTDKDIMEWCRAHLAHFKCPRVVVFAPLPKTSTGKVQKFELREQAKHL